MIELGSVEDPRIKEIEVIVSNHFNVSVSDLTVFYRDSPAKLLCCFLLHELLDYSIHSIARAYKIHWLFLTNNIKGFYIRALEDPSFFLEFTALQDQFLKIDKKRINTAI